MLLSARISLCTLSLAVCIGQRALVAQTCGVRCGVERWAVKTFTDDDTGLVDLAPRSASVLELRALRRPAYVNEVRRDSIELRTYRVRALLLGWKRESNDDDFHLVIADTSQPDSTMIVELPSARCSRVCSSRLVEVMTEARRAVERELGPVSTNYRPLRPARTLTVTRLG